MGINTDIAWCDVTWNIARGCTKVDADCKYCYMYRDSFDKTRYDPYAVVRTKTVFNLPLKVKEPSKIFTCSLTDFFHEQIDSYRHEAWDIIRQCPHHTFLILTKRPERIMNCLPPDWGNGWDNVWLGTSCGSQESVHRIAQLMQVPAKIRFASLEPLYGKMDITNKGLNNAYSFPTGYDSNGMGIEWTDPGDAFIGLDWVITGGESGHTKETSKYKFRPCELSWIEKIVAACKNSNVPVFVKQLGTHLQKEMNLKAMHATDIEEFPVHLQVREFPKTKQLV